jgi:energy-coupling factor transporter ATP-binding protein EcfA2
MSWQIDWAQLKNALPYLAFLVSVLGLVLSHYARVRATLGRGWVRLTSGLGFVEARYKAGFIKLHRELRNIYLDRIENVDVQATYIPLSVTAAADRIVRPALEVLLAPAETRLLIVGSPGSGKTTLMKCFSVGLLSGRAWSVARTLKADTKQNLIPLYVELREFASKRGSGTLADFISNHVLGKIFGLPDGRAFLKRLIDRNRCVVLLDGLDEVGQEDYEDLRLAIIDFLRDESPELPTARARVVMTCRKQNFVLVAQDWVPLVFPREVTLAPFSDDDIQQFIGRRASDLPADKSAAELWDEIRSSSVLDLHRTPLILTISIGLYMHVPRYSMPTSLATFYAEMVKELLQRHDFRTRAYLSKKNKFASEYKLRFLREFAFAMVQRPGQFEEFAYTTLAEQFHTFQSRVPQLTPADANAFIAEIIDNAGLVNRIRGDEVLVFSHRSIHEYFVALQLSKDPSKGVDLLALKAPDPLWRQIILFFAAMDHDQHERLLESLSASNVELAGQYLVVATNVPVSTVGLLVERLAAAADSSTAPFLPIAAALSAICRAYPAEHGAKALQALIALIHRVFNERRETSDRSHETLATLTDLSHEDLIRLLRSLAATESKGIIGACVTLSKAAGDDPATIGPLWDCLSVSDTEIAHDPDTGALVARLLELSTTEPGFQALQARRRLSPGFADASVRAFVYPFESGHDRGSNLVTLLAWADRTSAQPTERNGLLKAFQSRRSNMAAWFSLERDMNATLQSVRPYWFGLVPFAGGLVVGWALLFDRFRHAGVWGTVLQPLASQPPDLTRVWGVLLGVGLALPVLLGLLMFVLRLDDTPLALASGTDESIPSNPLVSLVDHDVKGVDRHGQFFWDGDTARLIGWCALLQIPWLVAGPTLLGATSSWETGWSAALMSLVSFWLPAIRFFEYDNRWYFRMPNPMVALVADRDSQRWIRRSATGGSPE